MREIFTDEEFRDMRHRIQTETLPRIANIRRDWEFSANSDSSPGEFMQPLLDSFEILKREFSDDASVAAIERQIERVNEWVAERTPEQVDDDDGGERRLGSAKAAETLSGGRSVFDDVDQ